MMRFVPAFVFLTGWLLGCDAPKNQRQDKSDSDTAGRAKGQAPKRCVRIVFTPSSGYEPEYWFEVRNDSLLAQDLNPFADSGSADFYKVRLSRPELDSLFVVADSVRCRDPYEIGWTDVWNIQVFVDDEKRFETERFSISTLPTDVRRLVQFLLRRTPITVDLQGFA